MALFSLTEKLYVKPFNFRLLHAWKGRHIFYCKENIYTYIIENIGKYADFIIKSRIYLCVLFCFCK